MLSAWGRNVHRFRGWVFSLSALVLIASLTVLFRGGTLAPAVFPMTEADRGQILLDRALERPGQASFVIIAHAQHGDVDAPAFRQGLERALAPLQRDARVARCVLPFDLSPGIASMLRSPDARSVLVQVGVRGDLREAQAAYRPLRDQVHPPQGIELTFTGNLAYKDDLDRTLARDLLRGEVLSTPLAAIVLLLVFGSIVASLLPVGVGGLAVIAGMAGVFLTSRVMDVTQYSLNVTSLVGLGVAIDYALFMVSRFRDELAAGLSTEQALERTMSTAGRAVLFSGVAVAIGMSGLLFYRGTFLASMGVAGALVVTLAVMSSLTLLPALLSWLGPRVNALPVGRKRRERSQDSMDRGFWQRLARWVMKRPIMVLVPTLALTLGAGLPFMRMKMAAASVTVLPHRVEARQGYDQLQRDFTELVANRVTVVVALPAGQSATDEAIVRRSFAYSRALARIDGVRRVESIVDIDPSLDEEGYVSTWALPEAFRPAMLEESRRLLSSDRVLSFALLTDGDAHSDRARSVVRNARALRGTLPGERWVTGQTALDLDTTHYVLSRTPWAVTYVMVMTCIVLFLLLGSLLLPIKAVLMNLLSLTASFGALVWIFEDGHLSSVLRFEPQPIEPVLPVVLFCSVFGLSMDYEVLMLSRMQEEYLRSKDNVRAVALGLERSAKLVTSAAAIMVAVFLAFAFAEVVILKAVGVGMALAVALDATVVRMLIVPATMRLFGHWNWWAPAPLARLHRWLGMGHVSEDREDPATSPEDLHHA
ncbi:MAG: MMPL family transporter [Deltaproteobacteria bacterium]|nr:MMPL family transporter [Deltaproteobacteria bacterium]